MSLPSESERSATLEQPIRREIAGVSVQTLAEEFGTPLYVYDLQSLDRQIQHLRSFDTIRYAQKANGSLAILCRMRAQGVQIDAVSAGEIIRGFRAGYAAQGSPDPMVYTADLFTADALRLVQEHGIAVNCGSAEMIAQYAEGAPRRDLTLRINPGFGHGHHQKTNTGGPSSKHGLWHEELEAAVRWTRDLGLEVRGLHMHIGSGNDLEHLSRVCQAMEQVALQVGDSVMRISAGGGLPVPYRAEEPRLDVDRYFDLWNATRTRLVRAFGHEIELEVEPGRYLVAEAGYLIAEVLAVKRTPAAWFYILDAGFQTLIRPALYGAYHAIRVCPRDSEVLPPPEPTWVDAVVAGPLCESGDVFTQDAQGQVRTRRVPMLRRHDWVVIETAGA